VASKNWQLSTGNWQLCLGAVAQLGERLVCNQEATGSIPVSSTRIMSKKNKRDMASVIGLFLQQYQRKAQRGAEPNDRQYDRKIERYIRRMKPEELDKVLNGEEDDRLDES
jgi:GH15 family glucan-1,4-alpha-glucosidase